MFYSYLEWWLFGAADFCAICFRITTMSCIEWFSHSGRICITVKRYTHRESISGSFSSDLSNICTVIWNSVAIGSKLCLIIRNRFSWWFRSIFRARGLSAWAISYNCLSPSSPSSTYISWCAPSDRWPYISFTFCHSWTISSACLGFKSWLSCCVLLVGSMVKASAASVM